MSPQRWYFGARYTVPPGKLLVSKRPPKQYKLLLLLFVAHQNVIRPYQVVLCSKPQLNASFIRVVLVMVSPHSGRTVAETLKQAVLSGLRSYRGQGHEGWSMGVLEELEGSDMNMIKMHHILESSNTKNHVGLVGSPPDSWEQAL